MRLGSGNAERELQIQRYWDALVTGAPADDLARLAAPLDPTLVALIARVRASHQRRLPDPAFVIELERRVMDTFTRTQTVPVPLFPGLPGARRDVPQARVQGGGLSDLPTSRRRWLSVRLATVLLLVVTLLAVWFSFRPANHPAVLPAGGTPTAIAAPTVPGTVPMFRADAAHTGRMPGPGPVGNPTIRWHVATSDHASLDGCPVVAGGSVYVVTRDGTAYAFDAATGVERWHRRSSSGQWASTPAVVGGVVYAGMGDLYALDAATGKERWHVSLGSFQASPPAVAGGVVYAGGGGNHLVYAVDAASGAVRWQFATKGETSPGPAVSGGVVYAASLDNPGQTLYALDAATGAERWHVAINTGSYGDLGSPPAVADGVVYVGGNDDSVRAYDAATGVERWHFATAQPVAGAVAVVDGLVYVGSDDGNVYALDAATGTERWRFTTGGAVGSSPGVVDGVVYVASKDGNLYALDAVTGAERWHIETGAPATSSPAIVDGMVYIGTGFSATNPGELFAIGGGPATPDSTPIA